MMGPDKRLPGPLSFSLFSSLSEDLLSLTLNLCVISRRETMFRFGTDLDKPAVRISQALGSDPWAPVGREWKQDP